MDSPDFISHAIYGTANPNVTAAGTAIITKAPSASLGGGVTIAEVILNAQSGTATFQLVDLGTTGTVVAGTVCTLTYAQTGRAPFVGTPAGYFLGAGKYLGLVYPAGTIIPPANLLVGLLDGRGAA